jgi:two-component system, LytTR family, response regulator
MNSIRTLVVDDQRLARERLVSLLNEEYDVDVIGECDTGRSTVEMIGAARPDLVFLDMQMPELDGFGVVNAVGPDRMPLVIFVTAYDEHALRAFEIHAIDYLLKPFSNERFRRALSHARMELQRRRAEEFSRRLLDLMRDVEQPAERPARLMLRTEGKVAFLSPEEVNWVEAEGNYARLYLEDGSHVIRETMKDIEGRLGERFVRIHRSHAVNVGRVNELRSCGGGEYEVVLRDGTVLKVGHSFRAHLEERLRMS